jgi:tetraacyldisaccharide 4'-kinase
VAFAGVGNPEGFLHTVRSLGMHVVAGCWFDDHHVYRLPADFAELTKGTRERGIEAWVTTLKDWVKLRDKPMPEGAPPVWHVRIEAMLGAHEGELLRSRLATLRAREETGWEEGVNMSPGGRPAGGGGTTGA